MVSDKTIGVLLEGVGVVLAIWFLVGFCSWYCTDNRGRLWLHWLLLATAVISRYIPDAWAMVRSESPNYIMWFMLSVSIIGGWIYRKECVKMTATVRRTCAIAFGIAVVALLLGQQPAAAFVLLLFRDPLDVVSDAGVTIPQPAEVPFLALLFWLLAVSLHPEGIGAAIVGVCALSAVTYIAYHGWRSSAMPVMPASHRRGRRRFP